MQGADFTNHAGGVQLLPLRKQGFPQRLWLLATATGHRDTPCFAAGRAQESSPREHELQSIMTD
jgi:hypothetical protein